MKKKLVICMSVIAVTAIFIAGGLEYTRSRATAKLKSLEAGEIVSATVVANPPGREAMVGNRIIDAAPVDTNQDEQKATLKEPPVMQVTCGAKDIMVYPGNYSWDYDRGDGTGSGIVACGLHPLDAKEHMAVLQWKEDAAVLMFETEPDSITVRCWAGEYWGNTSALSEKISVKDNKVELKEGEYIYEVTAEWSRETYKGTAHYTFYTEE